MWVTTAIRANDLARRTRGERATNRRWGALEYSERGRSGDAGKPQRALCRAIEGASHGAVDPSPGRFRNNPVRFSESFRLLAWAASRGHADRASGVTCKRTADVDLFGWGGNPPEKTGSLTVKLRSRRLKSSIGWNLCRSRWIGFQVHLGTPRTSRERLAASFVPCGPSLGRRVLQSRGGHKV